MSGSSNEGPVAQLIVPVANPSNDMLGAAVRAVAQSIKDVGEYSSLILEVLLQRLGEIETVIRRCCEPGAAKPVTISSTDATSRQLFDLLRRQILLDANAARDAEAYAESHKILVAIEFLQVTPLLNAGVELPWMRRDATTTDILVEVAHDMRSPLGAILFLVDRVRSGQSGPVNAAQAKQLGLAYSAAFELNTLTADLTELAHGGRRLIEADPMPFAISTVVLSVEAMVRPIAEEKGLKLTMNVPPREVRVGNSAALTRVLLNLCTNACKFTDSGEVELTVDVCDNDAVRFTVRDTGRGLPADLAHSLLAKAKIALSSSPLPPTRFSGAGLGLAICSRLVGAMGGSLSLVSSECAERPAAGTTLSFTLPLPRL